MEWNVEWFASLQHHEAKAVRRGGGALEAKKCNKENY
jgi:hypothetical protein